MIAILAVAVCLGYLRRETPASGPTQTGTESSAPPPSTTATVRPDDASVAESLASATAVTTTGLSTSNVTRAVAPVGAIDPGIVSRALETVLSTNSTYAEKQAAWKQLIQAGKLDDAISALEQKRATDPAVADYAATLGHAYIKKCGVINDMRDQGLLAMSADKLFDTALSLDPSNWEARFTKAVAMSYWPPNMNKGDEVLGHFQTLIQQQELKPAQPEFAETYLWMGDQYQKMGQHDNAVSIWGRGTKLFPAHEGLRGRLAGAGQ
jgi:hypothetical protein